MKRIFQLFLILMLCASCSNKKDISKNVESKPIATLETAKKVSQPSSTKYSNEYRLAHKHFNLGNQYSYHSYGHDIAKAIEQYKLAAELKYPPAFGELAFLYSELDLISNKNKNEQLAFKYVQQGKQYNDPLSFAVEGAFYCNGIVVKKDIAKGLSILNEAIKNEMRHLDMICLFMKGCEDEQKYGHIPDIDVIREEHIPTRNVGESVGAWVKRLSEREEERMQRMHNPKNACDKYGY